MPSSRLSSFDSPQPDSRSGMEFRELYKLGKVVSLYILYIHILCDYVIIIVLYLYFECYSRYYGGLLGLFSYCFLREGEWEVGRCDGSFAVCIFFSVRSVDRI